MLKVTNGLIVCAVRDLMRESKSGQEWRQNAETVKTYFGGDYPEWWYREIIESGIMYEAQLTWAE